jgi:hypothetical protein
MTGRILLAGALLGATRSLFNAKGQRTQKALSDAVSGYAWDGGLSSGPEGRQSIAPTVRSGTSRDPAFMEARRAGTSAAESRKRRLCRPSGPWIAFRRSLFPDLTVGAIRAALCASSPLRDLCV